MQSLRLILLAGGLWSYLAVAAGQAVIRVDRIEGPNLTARKLTATLGIAVPQTLDLAIDELNIAGSTWRNLRFKCPDFRRSGDDLTCVGGALESPARFPVEFRHSLRTNALEIMLNPAPGEVWRLKLEPEQGRETRTFTIALTNAPVTRFAQWWPAGWPRLTAGSAAGTITFNAEHGMRGDLAVSGIGFSDASGLHAGEKIAATVGLRAQPEADRWQWQANVNWKSGDVFWSPLFMSGAGHVLNVAGVLDARQVSIERGQLALAGIGAGEFTASVDRASGRLATATGKTVNLDLAALYGKLLKPALRGTAVGDLRAEGHADIAVRVLDGNVVAADLALRGVSFEDRGRRFALFGVEGTIPWHRDQPTAAQLRIAGGEALHVAFGAFDLPLELRGIRMRTHQVQIPVLDGALTINDFATSGERDSWRWRFSGGITPISMEQFTAALGLPVMHGTLSAVIPTVSYGQSTLRIGGALLFKIFDGTIVAQNLVLETPFGKVPRLTADVDMRNLDLDLLTRTFSFGDITGRIDAHVGALEFVDWEPVKFDARVASSPGEYRRRISQRAVQNISALGGAGAAAAIQRSFLRFFGEFGYSTLGLSCKLQNGVCRMGGIENVPQGYVIVKGGGIPAINVLGYNRNVGWHELIQRLKRITGNDVVSIVE